MTHMDTLKFELEANRKVLESEMGTLAHYRRQYHHEATALGKPDSITARSCASVIREYEMQHIPRRVRFIEALEWIINEQRSKNSR